MICAAHGQANAEIAANLAPALTHDHEAPYIAHSLRGGGFDASEDGTGRGTPLVATHPYALAIRGRGDSQDLEYHQDGTANALLTPNGGRGGIGVGAIAFDTTQMTSAANRSRPKAGDPCHPLAAGAHAPAIAYDDVMPTMLNGANTAAGHGARSGHNKDAYVVPAGMQVRRLTPRECERLQGFPDDYTAVPYRGKPAADGSRYRALGNSWAVPGHGGSGNASLQSTPSFLESKTRPVGFSKFASVHLLSWNPRSSQQSSSRSQPCWGRLDKPCAVAARPEQPAVSTDTRSGQA